MESDVGQWLRPLCACVSVKFFVYSVLKVVGVNGRFLSQVTKGQNT